MSAVSQKTTFQHPSLAPRTFNFSPPIETTSFSTKEVYVKIKDLICKVLGSNSEGTGFFVKSSRFILTAAHIKAEHIEYKGKNYEVEQYSTTEDNLKRLSSHDLQLLEIKLKQDEAFPLMTSDFFELPKEYVALEEGEEVFFGGYPLKQKVVTLHKGYISSISEINGFHSFTIDGNVVPGNSGSPVVMQKDRKLHLIGVIRSEISDLHPKFQEITNILDIIKETETTHSYLDNLERQAIPMGYATNLHMAFSSVSANLSTGIGKAVHAFHANLNDILSDDDKEGYGSTISSVEEDHLTTISQDEFPVMRGERLPGNLGKDNQFKDWYHESVKGKPLSGKILNRGIYGGADNINADEEKVLWDYYLNNVVNSKKKPSFNETYSKLKKQVERFIAEEAPLQDKGAEILLAILKARIEFNNDDEKAKLKQLYLKIDPTGIPDE